MMKKLVNLSLLLVSLLITNCAVGPNFRNPEVEIPTEYRMTEISPDSLLNLKWWELFDDPVLDSLVYVAINYNKDLLIAISRVEEARATHGFTKADLFPQLNIQAGATRGNFIQGIKFENESNNFFVAPVLNWELDFWGKFRRANESAKAQLLASQYGLRTVQIGLISEVVSTYFQLLDYRQRLKISEQTLKSRKYSLDIIQKRFDKGIIPEIDLNQAQIQNEIARSAIPIHERLIVKTENSLSILLGQLPDEVKHGNGLNQQNIPPQIPVGLPAQILQRRPDIYQAQYQLQAQNAKIGVAQAMRLPAISLTGMLGFASDDLSKITDGDPGWSISGSLLGPIFNFKKNIRRVDIEEERTKQARYNYEYTVLNAFREVEDALTEVRTYKQQLEAVKNKLVAARNAATLSRERYDKGVTSYLEVLETERTLFDVELEFSQLRKDYLNAYVKLYKALGGGWISKDEKNYQP